MNGIVMAPIPPTAAPTTGTLRLAGPGSSPRRGRDPVQTPIRLMTRRNGIEAGTPDGRDPRGELEAADEGGPRGERHSGEQPVEAERIGTQDRHEVRRDELRAEQLSAVVLVDGLTDRVRERRVLPRDRQVPRMTELRV